MERIVALIDGNGVVKNTIVVDETWDYGGIETGGYAVGIGCVYDFAEKKFVNADGSVVKTIEDLAAEPAEILSLLLEQ